MTLVEKFLRFFVLLFAGDVSNALNLLALDFAPPYKAEIIRGLGLAIPPIGGVVGFIPLQDGPSK